MTNNRVKMILFRAICWFGSLSLPLIVLSCATIPTYDFIGVWEQQPGTLTYINHKHHIKITFPSNRWFVYSGPHEDLKKLNLNWATPETGAYHLLVAQIRPLGVSFQIMIDPTAPNINLDEYVALEKAKFEAELRQGIYPSTTLATFEFREIQRNGKKTGKIEFDFLEKGFEMKAILIIIEEKDRFTTLAFGGPEELALKYETDFWSVVDSYQYLE